MNIQVRYYSKSGNTKKLAQAIAQEAKVEALTVEKPITSETDILFLGGAVYAYGIDSNLKKFINELNPALVKEAVIFSDSALAQRAYTAMAALLKKKGINVLDENFYCRGQFLNLHKNHPNEADLAAAKEFTKKIISASV